MYRSFKEIEEAVLKRGTLKKLALAASADDVALGAVVEAQKKGGFFLEMVADCDFDCDSDRDLKGG